jgi:predicted CopG family antitoxin
MKEYSKDRSVTIRINKDVYQKLVDETLERSVNEGRLIKISEIIREKLEK